jgi:hypothetical protein
MNDGKKKTKTGEKTSMKEIGMERKLWSKKLR